jgi:hypothetical protein
MPPTIRRVSHEQRRPSRARSWNESSVADERSLSASKPGAGENAVSAAPSSAATDVPSADALAAFAARMRPSSDARRSGSRKHASSCTNDSKRVVLGVAGLKLLL